MSNSRVMTYLTLTNARILKTINIKLKFNTDTITIGQILYMRKPTGTYKLGPNFGDDEVDNFILNAVKNVYPDTESQSQNILFDKQLEDLNLRVSSENTKQGYIAIYPDFSPSQLYNEYAPVIPPSEDPGTGTDPGVSPLEGYDSRLINFHIIENGYGAGLTNVFFNIFTNQVGILEKFDEVEFL